MERDSGASDSFLIPKKGYDIGKPPESEYVGSEELREQSRLIFWEKLRQIGKPHTEYFLLLAAHAYEYRKTLKKEGGYHFEVQKRWKLNLFSNENTYKVVWTDLDEDKSGVSARIAQTLQFRRKDGSNSLVWARARFNKFFEYGKKPVNWQPPELLLMFDPENEFINLKIGWQGLSYPSYLNAKGRGVFGEFIEKYFYTPIITYRDRYFESLEDFFVEVSAFCNVQPITLAFRNRGSTSSFSHTKCSFGFFTPDPNRLKRCFPSIPGIKEYAQGGQNFRTSMIDYCDVAEVLGFVKTCLNFFPTQEMTYVPLSSHSAPEDN